MPKAKPADGNGGHQIIINEWKSHTKGSLRAFFSATLPSGMVLHSLMLHESHGKRWVGLPAREWKDASGVTQYSRLIEFSNRETADKFRDAVLSAVDKYLEGHS